MSTDERAAEIVGRCRERIDAGEDVDIDAVVRAHPEIAATLRARFDALARLDRGFGHPAFDDEQQFASADLRPRLGKQEQVVQLRYFGGFNIEDTAHILDISPAQVKRDWTTARAFLLRELAEKDM